MSTPVLVVFLLALTGCVAFLIVLAVARGDRRAAHRRTSAVRAFMDRHPIRLDEELTRRTRDPRC